MRVKRPKPQRAILVTATGAPFQPVRLYYAAPDPPFIAKLLSKIDCTVEDQGRACWLWLLRGQAAGLFEGHTDESAVLAELRFPRTGMTLEATSVAEAVAAARFFGRALGHEIEAIRCRVVNRMFTVDEGRPGDLKSALEHDVTVIDPRATEKEIERVIDKARALGEDEPAILERLRKLQHSRGDVPMVEDFPLAPEEETPELDHLATTLQLRMIRAFEHWRGNTHLTLAAIIERSVKAPG